MSWFFFNNCKIYYHPSWQEFLTSVERTTAKIHRAIIGTNYTPATPDIFRFLRNDLFQLKHIIIGADPYPQPGVATGRAFEVSNLASWHDKSINQSLKNILKLIHKHTFGLSESASIEKVRADITNGKFNILPPNELFDSWEQQGVLLLNTALTCEINCPGRHIKYWEPFIFSLLLYINKTRPNLFWHLWGANAVSTVEYVEPTNKTTSQHPTARRNNKQKGFLFSQSFSSKDINWTGT